MTASQPPWRHPEFARGARDMTGISLGIGAWGLVTGIAMVKAGLGLPLAITMSLLVFAGSAQLASLPLIAQGAPLWVIWATAFCVNLRFVIFSAAARDRDDRRPPDRHLEGRPDLRHGDGHPRVLHHPQPARDDTRGYRGAAGAATGPRLVRTCE
jgi:hypothetical protein